MSEGNPNPYGFGRGRGQLPQAPSISSQASSVPKESSTGSSMGRGSLLTRLSQSSSSSSSAAATISSLGPSASDPSRSMGRGAVLMALSKASSSGSVAPSVASQSSSSGSGRSGRGLALAKYITKARGVASESTGSIISFGRGSSAGSSKKGVEALSSDMSRVSVQGSSEEEDIPTIRMGSTGERFEVLTNWVRIGLSPDKAVFEYDVKLKPTVESKSARIKIVSSLTDTIGNVRSFDGVKLWLPLKLAKSITMASIVHPITKEDVQITITYQKRTNMMQSIQLYNVLFSRCAKALKMAMVQRNYYLPTQAVLVPEHKMEIWPGYVFSAHHQEGGAMLNIDVSHKLLRTNTVMDTMKQLATKERGGSTQERCKHNLIGSIVLTRYNNRTYRIDDIDFDLNPMSTFTNSDNKQITYVDYYKNAYGIQIEDLQQPLLVHIPKVKHEEQANRPSQIHLVPEKCYMTGLTDEMRQDFRVMKDLAQHTRLTPQVRKLSIDKFIRNVNNNPAAVQVLADWGIRLMDDQMHVEARGLNPESIRTGSASKLPNMIADWSREATNERVISAVDVTNWVIIYARRVEKGVRDFLDTYSRVVRTLGIRVTDPKHMCLQNDSARSYTDALRSAYNDELQLAVIVFPFQMEDRYSAVKKLACHELGLPTQCIVGRTITNDKKLRSVTQKIALQINCKLGGELWAVKIPLKGLMTCGVDVYHDPRRRNKSVVGFVASMNSEATKWNSHVTFQGQGEEIINGMLVSFHRSIQAYYKVNHAYPSSIVVYRDGVGDGMFDLTKAHEIPQLATVFNSIPNYKPNFYYVIVQKRINTRLLRLGLRGQLDNPPPGTVVDHTITKRNYYDFLLISQLVRQGTVSPTHYVVLQDGGLDPDKMQQLTYKMTHMYYNWPGTIRVPAPCQYAHKIAYLIGENVKAGPKPNLYDKLFFL